MNQLDFGPIYNGTGSIMQLEYAKKCIQKSSNCIALKNNEDIVFIVEKTKVSNLIDNHKNNLIVQVTPTILSCFSGLVSDAISVYGYIKEQLNNHYETYEEDCSYNFLKQSFNNILHAHTSYYGLRVTGCSFLTAIYDSEIQLLYTEPNGSSKKVKAYAIGRGSTRAKTDLEKLKFNELSLEDLISNGIRIMYRSFDPLKDKEFDLEIVKFGKSTNFTFKRLKLEEYQHWIDEYEGMTVDDE